ncbi:MAG: NAD+ synthase, partial [Betaproteobacteria bacterium]|nr:NAD+ synthase [Betaproteobacteria bacterium]
MMKIAIAQLNPIVGDLTGNVERLLVRANEAKAAGAGLLVAPELALCGYPPEDLLFRHDFIEACAKALQQLARQVNGIRVLVGHPQQVDGRLFNAASLLGEGRVLGTYLKQRLPNYQVFDEARYFAAGDKPFVFEHEGVKVGVLICEDIWFAEPVVACKAAGAEMLLVLNASPYDFQKLHLRYDVVRARVAECGLPTLYVHMTGGQDELLFDGASFAMNADGVVAYQEREFVDVLGMVEWQGGRPSGRFFGPQHEPLSVEASVYQALVVALRDYVEKNRFPGVLLGLSGGVDSALTLAIAVDALGAAR